jgi:hypothetical protein
MSLADVPNLLEAQVTSLQEELDLWIAAVIKAAAVGSPSLVPLLCECDFGSGVVPSPARVDAALTASMNAARVAANDRVLKEDVLSGETLREILLAKSKLFQVHRRDVADRDGFVAYMTGSGGVEELHIKIIKEFPTGGNPNGLRTEGVGVVLKHMLHIKGCVPPHSILVARMSTCMQKSLTDNGGGQSQNKKSLRDIVSSWRNGFPYKLLGYKLHLFPAVEKRARNNLAGT